MNKVIELLGDKSCYYLDHTCKTIDKSLIHIPSPDTIDKIWLDSDRNIKVLNSLQSLLGHGRLANTGYVSILPSIKISSIPPGLLLLRTRSISTRRIS